MEQIPIKNKICSPYPLYGVGIFCLVYAFVFDLYRLSDYFILTGLSIFVYLFLRNVVFHDIVIETQTYSNNTDILAEMKKEAFLQIDLLNQRNKEITNEKISQNLNEIVKTIEMIFAYLQEYPDDVLSIRKILSYYLPTLLDLLQTYARYETFIEPDAQLKETSIKIEEAVEMMKEAIDHKYEDLYQNQMIDANADIKVLKKMLQQDGLWLDKMKEENN